MAPAWETTNQSIPSINEKKGGSAVAPSIDRTQKPQQRRLESSSSKPNLGSVSPAQQAPEQRQNHKYLRRASDTSGSSQDSEAPENPPLDRSKKPRTFNHSKITPVTATKEKIRKTKSSHDRSIPSSHSDTLWPGVPPIDRSKKPRGKEHKSQTNSATFPTRAKVNKRKKKSIVRCQTAPATTTEDLSSHPDSDHDYDEPCSEYDTSSDSDHEYDEPEDSGQTISQEEEISTSNGTGYSSETDSSHDYDEPEGDFWQVEIQAMDQTPDMVSEKGEEAPKQDAVFSHSKTDSSHYQIRYI